MRTSDTNRPNSSSEYCWEVYKDFDFKPVIIYGQYNNLEDALDKAETLTDKRLLSDNVGDYFQEGYNNDNDDGFIMVVKCLK